MSNPDSATKGSSHSADPLLSFLSRHSRSVSFCISSALSPSLFPFLLDTSLPLLQLIGPLLSCSLASFLPLLFRMGSLSISHAGFCRSLVFHPALSLYALSALSLILSFLSHDPTMTELCLVVADAVFHGFLVPVGDRAPRANQKICFSQI